MTKKCLHARAVGTAIALLAAGFSGGALAANWSTTETHFQYGNLDTPGFAGGGDSDTRILTFQHASGWQLGDNFFFIDYLDDNNDDDFNDEDFYAEWYSNFSLGKITGQTVGAGPIRDVGLLAGINLSGDSNVRKWLPGVRLSWDIPGFAFLNTDFTAYIDDSDGVSGGTRNAPSEDDSFMVDVNWAYPFALGSQRFSIEGHVEYIGGRDNEFGGDVEWWILGQPQFRWDIGHAAFGAADQLFVGIEYQFWINKLGDEDTDESAVQALGVWRF